jgi:hypothetical protein
MARPPRAALLSPARTGEACRCWPAGGPWSEALRRAAGTRPQRFLAASPVPVIRVAHITTGASVRLARVALAIPTRRDDERSEGTSGGRVPASRKRAPDGQCRHGSFVRAPAALSAATPHRRALAGASGFPRGAFWRPVHVALPRLGPRAEKCASGERAVDARSSSGHPRAGAQSVGRPCDPYVSGESAPPRPGAPAAHF